MLHIKVKDMKKTWEAKFRQTAQDKLELKKGGGCIGCFGVPFFLAGLFMLLATMQIIPLSNAKEMPWWSWIILFFMGLIFTGVGAGLVFGRNWITIDKTKRRIWIAWGLLRPMRGEQYDLDYYASVVLKHNPGDSDTAETFPISLKATDDRTELPLLSPQDYGTSMEQAMLLATFLRIKLEDMTTDNPIELNPQEILDGQKLLHKTGEIHISAQPAYMKTEVTENADELQIRIPGQPFHKYNLIGMIIPLFMLVFVIPYLLSFFESTRTPYFVQYFFISFIGLFFILLPLLETFRTYLRSRKVMITVIIKPGEISINYLTMTNKGSLILTLDDILGIDYGTKKTAIINAHKEYEKADSRHLTTGGISAPYSYQPRWMRWLEKFSRARGIIIKSKKGLFTFADGLPDDEVYYLYTLVLSYLNK